MSVDFFLLQNKKKSTTTLELEVKSALGQIIATITFGSVVGKLNFCCFTTTDPNPIFVMVLKVALYILFFL